MADPKFERLQGFIERIVLLPVRLRTRPRARAKRKARRSALATVEHALRGASKLNAVNVAKVFNVGMYVLLLDDDLAYFTDDLVSAIGYRRRAFLAKQEAVLIYEAAEDLTQLLGKDFREALKALGVSKEQIAKLNAVSSDLNQFWEKQREFLGDIRNILAAHRDHDTLKYLASLESLKPLRVMQTAAELSALLERLIAVITELATLTTGTDQILQDMLRTGKKNQVGKPT